MNATSYIQTGAPIRQKKSDSPLLNAVRKLSDELYLTTESDARQGEDRSVIGDLRSIGFSRFQLDRRESKHIAAYLKSGEHIMAAIRGHISGLGGVLMVATDSRLLYLHDIPLFSNFEEFSYEVVSGVSVNRAAVLASVTVFTKFKTYELDYVNTRQAERFLHYVESRIYPSHSVSATNQFREAPIR